MSTLAVRAPRDSKSLPSLSGLARGASVLLTVIDVLAEAQHLADEVRQNRYQMIEE